MRWLDDEVASFEANGCWIYSRVSIGPIDFCVCLEQESGFLPALDAFFEVISLETPRDDLPIIFVVGDTALIEHCINLSPAELSTAQQRTKNSTHLEYFNWDSQRMLLKYFNATTRRGVFVAADLAQLPSWEWFSPLKEFIHLLALERAAWLAHAATVGGGESSGVLLVGPGGSGKSTTCTQLIQSDFRTCGDDYVLLANEKDGVFAYAIYRTLKILPKFNLVEGMQQVAISKQSDIQETGKKVFFFCKVDEDGSLISCMPIRQIFGLQLVENQEIELEFRALSYTYFAMSSHGQIPAWLDRSLFVSRAIFERLPRQMLEVKRDKSGLAALTSYIKKCLL